MTDERSENRITLNLRSLVGGNAAPPDFVSVLDTAKLRVTAGTLDTTQVLPLEQSDSTAVFDVAVESDSARFRLDVLSNNLTLLYQADTTVAVNLDNFAVQITPRAVNGVLVIWPRNPRDTLFTDPDGGFFIMEQRLIRNAGSIPLVWNVDSLASDPIFLCRVRPSQDLDCRTQHTLNPSPVPDTVEVFYPRNENSPTRIITFTSNVGQATFQTGIP
jgi:hypothetical protein